jgi:hypothetical protein
MKDYWRFALAQWAAVLKWPMWIKSMIEILGIMTEVKWDIPIRKSFI